MLLTTCVVSAVTLGLTAAMPEPPHVTARLTASLPAQILEVGGEYEIKLTIDFTTGWSASDAGVPDAILQIDVPDAIDLVGKKLTTYEQLQHNEFLEEPWERLIDTSEQSIRFTLLREPVEGETIGLNVVVYLSSPDGEDAVFVRRHVDLPIMPGASAESNVEARTSDWGVNGTVQIGEAAPLFTLPHADGTMLDLADLLGKTPLIVTTYRAFW